MLNRKIAMFAVMKTFIINMKRSKWVEGEDLLLKVWLNKNYYHYIS
jgi:hypothetical protein